MCLQGFPLFKQMPQETLNLPHRPHSKLLMVMLLLLLM